MDNGMHVTGLISILFSVSMNWQLRAVFGERAVEFQRPGYLFRKGKKIEAGWEPDYFKGFPSFSKGEENTMEKQRCRSFTFEQRKRKKTGGGNGLPVT